VYLASSSKERIFNDMTLTERHLNLTGYPDCHPLWPGRGKMIQIKLIIDYRNTPGRNQ